MRTTFLVTLIAALASFAGCTVKDVDAPAFAGPSSMARTIVMTASRDSLPMDGASFTEISLRAQVPAGESDNIRLRAQIFVDGVPQDYGLLDNKTPITPTVIRYYAPPGSTNPSAQVAQTVTIVVTPDQAGDFRAEVPRQLDIRLVPVGIVQPINPSLVADFTVTPSAPQLFDTVTFSAATTTNGGTACGSACTYAWSFGDGTGGNGMVVTHQYRSTGSVQVTLAVTDGRGSRATAVQTVLVATGTPPTASFTMSPTPATVNREIFFDAGASRPAGVRRIVNYNWNFGDRTSASGVATSHRYTAPGTYAITLQVTDDAGTVGQLTQTLTVSP